MNEAYDLHVAGRTWKLVPVFTPKYPDGHARRVVEVDVAARVIKFDAIEGERGAPRAPLVIAVCNAVSRAWEEEVAAISAAHRGAAAPPGN